MKSTVEYLDEAKKRLEITSDYALAKRLGLSQQAVSAYRKAGHTLGDEAAVAIAAILRIDPLIVIAHANHERAKTQRTREIWASISDRFANASTAITEKFSESFNCLVTHAKPCFG